MLDRPFDPDEGCDMGLPFRSLDGRLGVEHRHSAGFVAIALLGVDALRGRQRLGDGAGGLDILAERGLIVLDLDDQMGFGGGGGLESFFGNAWRRR